VVSIYDEDDVLPPQPVPDGLAPMLAQAAGATSVYVKYRPKQASRVPEDEMATLAPPLPVFGPDLSTSESGVDGFVAQEKGLRYLIRSTEGLSSGLFADMRESRARVRAWSAGQTVLNTFAYTCGFGVAATAGGVARVRGG
jgi:23S rRNA (cytosine1962-C5)-methyltransferase